MHPLLTRVVRYVAIGLWAAALARDVYLDGIPVYRSDLLLWLVIGMAAASVGRRALWTVLVDFVPLAVVLIGYDYLRGLADTLGMPTWWHPQLDLDRWLLLGHEPNVWLQAHLRYPTVRWWDLVVTLCYTSFFFLPYVVAAVLWLRSRADFYRWSLRFVALSLLGFALFALVPAAPPWAAADCSAADVADHPHNPPCLSGATDLTRDGLLGTMTGQRPGTVPWVERIALRGFGELHLHFAQAIITAGQGGVDLVAAVPSLHAGGIMLFSIFLWRRSNRWCRALLIAYPLLMAFSLVYGGEHYLSDVLAGWLLAALVSVVADRIERRWSRTRGAAALRRPGDAAAADTLVASPG